MLALTSVRRRHWAPGSQSAVLVVVSTVAVALGCRPVTPSGAEVLRDTAAAPVTPACHAAARATGLPGARISDITVPFPALAGAYELEMYQAVPPSINRRDPLTGILTISSPGGPKGMRRQVCTSTGCGPMLYSSELGASIDLDLHALRFGGPRKAADSTPQLFEVAYDSLASFMSFELDWISGEDGIRFSVRHADGEEITGGWVSLLMSGPPRRGIFCGHRIR